MDKNFDLFTDFRAECKQVSLVVANFEQLTELASIPLEGLFDEGEKPTISGWYDPSKPVLNARKVFGYNMNKWAELNLNDLTLPFTILSNGKVVGTQGLQAESNFAIGRELGTGSWISKHYRGLGIGKLARCCALSVAFELLDAQTVVSSALLTNIASQKVSLACGYLEDGFEVHVDAITKKRSELVRFRITRQQYEKTTLPEVKLSGYEQLLETLQEGRK